MIQEREARQAALIAEVEASIAEADSGMSIPIDDVIAEFEERSGPAFPWSSVSGKAVCGGGCMAII
jgi:hypothetical protein